MGVVRVFLQCWRSRGPASDASGTSSPTITPFPPLAPRRTAPTRVFIGLGPGLRRGQRAFCSSDNRQ